MSHTDPTPPAKNAKPDEVADHAQDPIQLRMDLLLDQCVQKAMALIQEHGEFYPFGVTLDAQGEYSLTQAKLDEEKPTSAQVTDKLLRGLISEAAQGLYTTVAVVADVRLRQPGTGQFTDAIRVLMEDRERDPLDFFLPYQRQGKQIVTSDIMAQEAPAMIFTSSTPA